MRSAADSFERGPTAIANWPTVCEQATAAQTRATREQQRSDLERQCARVPSKDSSSTACMFACSLHAAAPQCDCAQGPRIGSACSMVVTTGRSLGTCPTHQGTACRRNQLRPHVFAAIASVVFNVATWSVRQTCSVGEFASLHSLNEKHRCLAPCSNPRHSVSRHCEAVLVRCEAIQQPGCSASQNAAGKHVAE